MLVMMMIVMSLVIVMLVQNSESFLIFEFTASRKLMVLGMEVRGLKVRPLKYFCQPCMLMLLFYVRMSCAGRTW